jgi:hypothetical protein
MHLVSLANPCVLRSCNANSFRKSHTNAVHARSRGIYFVFRGSTKVSIFDNSSGILNGLLTTSSIPASFATAICSSRALAVIAMMGIWVSRAPDVSYAQIRAAASMPFIIGISMSMSMIESVKNGVMGEKSLLVP